MMSRRDRSPIHRASSRLSSSSTS